MNGFQQSFLCQFDKKLFSTKSAETTRHLMQKMIAIGISNSLRDCTLITQHPKLRLMLGLRESNREMLDVYTYEFVLLAYECYERWIQSQKEYVAQIAPLDVKYEEEITIICDQPTDEVEDYEDDSEEEEPNEQGVDTLNYMMYEQETYPCRRQIGETNPFFRPSDYCLLGGGKNGRKAKIKKKKAKKIGNDTRMIARRPDDVQRPGRNDFPMVRHMVQPMTLVVPFAYDIASELFNNAGGTIVGEVYQSNDGYDWLLAILTSGMQFLNRQFQLYGKAKVLTFDIEYSFDNLEQNAIDFFFFSSSESPTSIAASKASLVAAAATGIYRGGFSLSEQYGKQSSRVWHDRIKPANVVGNTLKYNASDDYSFTQSSGPPRITYYSWYATTPLNAMSLGFSRRVRISANILFYDLLTLTSLLKPINAVNPRCKGSERHFA